MSLLNKFLLGADPEFVMVDTNGHMLHFGARPGPYVPWGLDHSGWVIEPHPKPELSVRALITNIKTALNDFATVNTTAKWRAGAYFHAPERTITLGGHVHIDQPQLSVGQRNGLDLFVQHLEALDILPKTECEQRRAEGAYGRMGDTRTEHGHVEYRTLPSWLFSQRVTKLCLIGTKLTTIDPGAPSETLGSVATASVKKLKALFERFSGKDDDVDWILTGGLFARLKGINVDRDLRDVWKVTPAKETPHWKEEEAKKKATLAPPARPPFGGVHEQDIYPWVVRVNDRFWYMPGMRQEQWRPDELPALIAAPTADIAAMTNGAHYTLHTTGRRNWVHYLFRVDQPWPVAIPARTHRISVDGIRVRFKLLAGQTQNDATNAIIREYCDLNGTGPGEVCLVDGLLFQSLGPTETERERADMDF
jgi:hypothetical protein